MEETDFSKLPKKERKKLKREMEREGEERNKVIKKVRNWVIGLSVLGLLGVGGWFLFKEVAKPLPGQQVADQGRDHVSKEEWEKFNYNSNPPTSGPHDAEWTKAGVYNEPQGEGYLIHSLEHGYIVISYNCTKQFSIFHLPFSIAFAHKTEEPHEEPATGSAVASPSPAPSGDGASGSLSDFWDSQECQDLKKQLTDLANEKRLWKLIVVPRPNLDTQIALTAWTKIDKMDSFDKDRLIRFIDSYRDHGPEKTME